MAPPKKYSQQCAQPYYTLPCALDLCDEVIALSHPGYRLLHQAAALHHGFDNGHIALSRRTLRALGWTSNDTFERALAELLNVGLLFQTRPQTGRKPRLFALAWLPVTKLAGLAFPPDAPVLMPEKAAVQAVLKDLNRGSAGATWNLQSGTFVACQPGGNGHSDMSRHHAFVACVPAHEFFLAARQPGHKDDLAACVPGGETQLRPVSRATKTGLPPASRATNSPYVGRCVQGLDAEPPDTPAPADDLLLCDQKSGGST